MKLSKKSLLIFLYHLAVMTESDRHFDTQGALLDKSCHTYIQLQFGTTKCTAIMN